MTRRCGFRVRRDGLRSDVVDPGDNAGEFDGDVTAGTVGESSMTRDGNAMVLVLGESLIVIGVGGPDASDPLSFRPSANNNNTTNSIATAIANTLATSPTSPPTTSSRTLTAIIL